MLPHKCPNCGRFVGQSIALLNGLGDIIIVTAMCSECGKVEVEDFDYEDFDVDDDGE